jgi:hypothetical protein
MINIIPSVTLTLHVSCSSSIVNFIIKCLFQFNFMDKYQGYCQPLW